MCTRRKVQIYSGSCYVFINVQLSGRNKPGWPAARSMKKDQRIRKEQTECGGSRQSCCGVTAMDIALTLEQMAVPELTKKSRHYKTQSFNQYPTHNISPLSPS
jgi:hypothetical protein